MKCSKLRKSIEAYLGGTLSPRQRKRFDSHLELCEECRAEIKRCNEENSLFRQALASRQMRGTLRNSVLARVRQEHARTERTVVLKRSAALWLVPVAAAAQFLIAFWLSGTLMFRAVEPAYTKGGDIVSVKWVKNFERYRYYALKGDRGIPGPVHAKEHMQVD